MVESGSKETMNILTEPKKEHSTFKFYINKNKEEDTYIHDFLGQPKVPLIGKYQRSDYAFGDVMSLITFTFDMDQTSQSSPKVKDFNPPKEIYDYLNVKDILTIDNNTKDFFNNQFYPKDKVKFHFIISSSPAFNQSQNEHLNIVPHVFLGPILDFSKQKRLIYNTPMTLFIPSDISKSSGVIQSDYNDKNSIDINNLRLEYSSIHMKGESLAFSPNNLNFNVNSNMSLNHFYMLITLKESEYHYLFYYIVINKKEDKNNIEKMLEKCSNLNELIKGLEMTFPNEDNNSKEIIKHLKQLFN